jgi:ornithine decarboxylase
VNASKVTFQQAEKLANQYGTPVMRISQSELQKKVEVFKKYLPRVGIYYAMKANPAKEIIQVFSELGLSFDVASSGEMRQLDQAGISGDRMIYANPVKTTEGLLTARELKVKRMTFDSMMEIDKIKLGQPKAEVLLRIQIENSDALVDLNSKFGVHPEEAPQLWRAAKEKGLDMAGLCFHVGSQAETTEAYKRALLTCRTLFDQAEEEGISFRILDIGGGFPISKKDFTPDYESYFGDINSLLERYFPKTEICAEPGRFLCGEAGTIITSVIGATQRRGMAFYTLDEGLYGAFSGKIFDHWDFVPRFSTEGEMYPSVLAGPSCDSIDIVVDQILLPPLSIGDLLIFDITGAYSYASAGSFNGFSKIRVALDE